MIVRRVGLALAALAVVVASCGDDGATDGAEATPVGDVDVEISLEIIGGELSGGVRREEASLGDSVRLVVTGDNREQVHVHGYDLYVDVTDGEGEIVFDALIPGRFEVELEESSQLLVELTVS